MENPLLRDIGQEELEYPGGIRELDEADASAVPRGASQEASQQEGLHHNVSVGVSTVVSCLVPFVSPALPRRALTSY